MFVDPFNYHGITVSVLRAFLALLIAWFTYLGVTKYVMMGNSPIKMLPLPVHELEDTKRW